jgi:hypothetical protein
VKDNEHCNEVRCGFDPGAASEVGSAAHATGGIVSITPDADEIAVAGYDVDHIEYHLSQIRRSG